MHCDPNGCTCLEVKSIANKTEPMPEDWKCISCRARERGKFKCRICSIKLIGDDEENHRTCTACYYS